jgi:hypothetical protein
MKRNSVMTNSDIARLRLNNQRIAGARFEQPADVVAWLGAVQAQDYLGSLRAVGLRMRKAVETDTEQALANRTIIRTWPMRGTLHFVAAADIRWMLELLTPRIVAGNARRLHRQLGLNEATFARSKDLFVRALEGGKQLTRNAMYEVLEAAGISTTGQRGLHILSRLAQDGLIARRKKFVDDRILATSFGCIALRMRVVKIGEGLRTMRSRSTSREFLKITQASSPRRSKSSLIGIDSCFSCLFQIILIQWRVAIAKVGNQISVSHQLRDKVSKVLITFVRR